MDLEEFFKKLQELATQDWFMRIIIGVVIVACTFLIARGLAYVVRRMLIRGRGPLPKNSIFLNIIKLFVWIIGVSILLGVCFNINLSAILTALGVGGIAVSLGFQATLSNLIGGLEVSISKIFIPGDNVQIGSTGLKGVIKDVSWRHTTIADYSGNQIMVPNSAMNTQTLVKLLPPNHITVGLIVNTTSEDLTEVANDMIAKAKDAVGKVATITTDPTVYFSEITDGGVKGSMSFVVAEDSQASDAIDACVRAIAPYAHITLRTLEMDLRESST